MVYRRSVSVLVTLAVSPTIQGARSKLAEQRAVASLILAITEVTIGQLLDFFLSSSIACFPSLATLTPQYLPLVTCQRGYTPNVRQRLLIGLPVLLLKASLESDATEHPLVVPG